MAHPVPVNVICGPLGSGKTTTVLAAFRHRPPEERWAILVNEFGQVGVDGAVLEAAGGVAVREIAGGCVCCVAGPMMRTALVKLLREVRPDRLLIEPSGLAHPASVLDQLRSPGIREAVDLRATILLIHPRRLLRSSDPELAEHLHVADVIVGTHDDVLGEDELNAFRAKAEALWPRPLRVLTTSFGEIEPAILDLRPAPKTILRLPHADHPREEHGWIWPVEAVFDEEALTALCQRLLRPGTEACPGGLARIKGLFRTPRGWRLLQGTPDTLRLEPWPWRRDSRCEAIASSSADWEAIERQLEETRRDDGSPRGIREVSEV
ncbi:MAG: GTP-binding protein [Alphaproteobacteria bacterium]|nr:GTP-binding protein [Alphaproteobacteria bacterium]MCB9695316.1 GTP-binding protein [Alphaproteobacteria bacterium]